LLANRCLHAWPSCQVPAWYRRAQTAARGAFMGAWGRSRPRATMAHRRAGGTAVVRYCLSLVLAASLCGCAAPPEPPPAAATPANTPAGEPSAMDAIAREYVQLVLALGR